jgi:hypothetical protein
VVLVALLCGGGVAYWRIYGRRRLYLFVLSGQSNMYFLDPDTSFTPEVTRRLGRHEVLVVRDAEIGRPIRRWYKRWRPAPGRPGGPADGLLYDRLMMRVRAALGDRRPDAACLVWMQGERDAAERQGAVYADSLVGLFAQFAADVPTPNVCFVIGRLSDFRGGAAYPDWSVVREAQRRVGDSDPRFRWIDTDDLNGPADAEHYTRAGFRTLGQRFADAAVYLIQANGY